MMVFPRKLDTGGQVMFECRICTAKSADVTMVCRQCAEESKDTLALSVKPSLKLDARQQLTSECLTSLMSAMQQAGGIVGKGMLEWSVAELIYNLGPNNITFIYTDPNEKT